MNFSILNPDMNEVRALTEQAIDENGVLRVMPSEFYARFSQQALSTLCILNGCYALPTFELLDVINQKIMEVSPSRNAIEIGSGNGVIGKALGITCTDNWMQDRPEVRSHYELTQQVVVPYGKHVLRMDAEQAVDHYRPDVVVASWVTHIYRPDQCERGGNAWGVDEAALLKKIRRYVFVANLQTHAKKPLLETGHTVIRGDFLFSRSMASDQCALIIWEGGRN
jgi:hypothetical protein